MNTNSKTPLDHPVVPVFASILFRLSAPFGILFIFLQGFSNELNVHGYSSMWTLYRLAGAILCAWFFGVTFDLSLDARFRSSRGRLILNGLQVLLTGYAFFYIAKNLATTVHKSLYLLIALTAVAVAIDFGIALRRLPSKPKLTRGQILLGLVGIVLVSGIAWSKATRIAYWTQVSQTIGASAQLLKQMLWGAGIIPLLILVRKSNRFKSQRKTLLLACDCFAVVVFLFFSFKKNGIFGVDGFTNLPLFLAPADYVRSGRILFWDIPSQYGLLNILLIAALKFWPTVTAFYVINSTLIFLGCWISYIAFRWAWPTLGAACIGIPFILATNILSPGWGPTMQTPQALPSTGPFRFAFCYFIIALLMAQYRGIGKNVLVAAVGSRLVIFFGSPDLCGHRKVCSIRLPSGFLRFYYLKELPNLKFKSLRTK